MATVNPSYPVGILAGMWPYLSSGGQGQRRLTPCTHFPDEHSLQGFNDFGLIHPVGITMAQFSWKRNAYYWVKTHRSSERRKKEEYHNITSTNIHIKISFLSIPERHTHKLIFQHWSHKLMRLKVGQYRSNMICQNHFVEQILTNSILPTLIPKYIRAICPSSIFVTGRRKKKFR